MSLSTRVEEPVTCCFRGCVESPADGHHACVEHAAMYARFAVEITEASQRQSVVRRTKAIRPRLCRDHDCDEYRVTGSPFCDAHSD